jgi:hypothetical protein
MKNAVWTTKELSRSSEDDEGEVDDLSDLQIISDPEPEQHPAIMAGHATECPSCTVQP